MQLPFHYWIPTSARNPSRKRSILILSEENASLLFVAALKSIKYAFPERTTAKKAG